MKNKILIISLILMINSIFLVSAIEPTYIFKKGNSPNLKVYCSDDGKPCEADYLCNITIQYPNTSVMFDNVPVTRNPSYYNISLPNLNTVGYYEYSTFCTNISDSGSSVEQYFLVNLTGEEFSTSKSFLYIAMLFFSIIFFFLTLYGTIKIPFKNKRDSEGKIISINDLKYFKLFLGFFTYILAIFITYLVYVMTGFLELNLLTSFFNFTFWLLIAFLAPTFILTFTIFIINWFADKKNISLIERNLRAK